MKIFSTKSFIIFICLCASGAALMWIATNVPYHISFLVVALSILTVGWLAR
jgi:hypothetical protein